MDTLGPAKSMLADIIDFPAAILLEDSSGLRATQSCFKSQL